MDDALKGYAGRHAGFHPRKQRAAVLVLDRMRDLRTPLMGGLRLGTLVAAWLSHRQQSEARRGEEGVGVAAATSSRTRAGETRSPRSSRCDSFAPPAESMHLAPPNGPESEVCRAALRELGPAEQLEKLAAMEQEVASGVGWYARQRHAPVSMAADKKCAHLQKCLQQTQRMEGPMGGSGARQRLLGVAMLSDNDAYGQSKKN